MGDVQSFTDVACQSTGDGCAGTRRYRWEFPVHDTPHDDEDPVSLVAPASRRVCPRQRDRDERFMVSDLLELAGKSGCAEDRRRETLSTGGAVLLRIDFGGLYAWVCVEFDRVGPGDADVYCLALRHYAFGHPKHDLSGIFPGLFSLYIAFIFVNVFSTF